MASALQKCPECKKDFETKKPDNVVDTAVESCDDRLPTSCRTCSHTVCRACVKHLPVSSTGFICCPNCNISKAFTKTPVVHEQMRELLEQLKILQGKTQGQTGAENSLSSEDLPGQRNTGLVEYYMDDNTKAKLDSDSFPFPTGTRIYREGHWGTVASSSSQKPFYSIRYGDGDPHWVTRSEMKGFIKAARKANPDITIGDVAYVCIGQPVYREFPGMGGVWGSVVDTATKSCYTVKYDDEKMPKEKLILHDMIIPWVQNAVVELSKTNDNNGGDAVAEVSTTDDNSGGSASTTASDTIDESSAAMAEGEANATASDELSSSGNGPADVLTERKVAALPRPNPETEQPSANDVKWEEMYQQLVAFKAQHGHCRVTQTGENARLGRWVSKQRNRYNKGHESVLAPERVQKLDAVGFVWDASEFRFQKIPSKTASQDDESDAKPMAVDTASRRPPTTTNILVTVNVKGVTCFRGTLTSSLLKDGIPSCSDNSQTTTWEVEEIDLTGLAETGPPKKKIRLNSDSEHPTPTDEPTTDTSAKVSPEGSPEASSPTKWIGFCSSALQIPCEAKWSGWKGFDQYVSDEAMPREFSDVLVLMDHLFQTAPDQGTFLHCLYENCGGGKEGYFKVAGDILEILESQEKDPTDFQFSQDGYPDVPATKAGLASLIELLLRLEIAPKLECRDEYTWEPTESKPSEMPVVQGPATQTSPEVGLNVRLENDGLQDTSGVDKKADDDDVNSDDDSDGDNDNNLPPPPINSLKTSSGVQIGKLLLPEEARGSGWKGFDKHVSDDTLPSKFLQILALIDFLFPVAPGQDTFVVALYEKHGPKGNGRKGSDVQKRLRELKALNPDAEGLRWHGPRKDYVPGCKKDLAAFIHVLIADVDVSPEIENPYFLAKPCDEELEQQVAAPPTTEKPSTPSAATTKKPSTPSAAPTNKPSTPSARKIDECIARVSSYKTGGDGGNTLKILKTYVSNVVNSPTEDKFKRINMENRVYKTKVKPFVGAKSLLMAAGFQPNQLGTALVLKEDADLQILADIKAKLKAALN